MPLSGGWLGCPAWSSWLNGAATDEGVCLLGLPIIARKVFHKVFKNLGGLLLVTLQSGWGCTSDL
jgi:hypothetical protein